MAAAMQGYVVGSLIGLLCLASAARGEVQAVVTHQSFDPSSGGSVTLRVDRGADVCCSAFDWVGIYQNGERLSYVHSEDDTNPSFTATLSIPSSGGTFTFAYSTSVDDWKMHVLKITVIPTGVTATVGQQAWDAVESGSITLDVLRGAAVCCSAFDWVGIYQKGERLSYEHSEDDTNPSFTATLSIPKSGGTFTFAYSTSLDGWKMHDLDLEMTFTDPAVSSVTTTPLPAGVTAAISEKVWNADTGGSVALTIARGPDVCCSASDWAGIYQNGERLSYVHSEDDTNPSFTATFSIPSSGGTFTFAYSTSLDGWKMHDLDLEMVFAQVAPAIPMATIIPTYWWPTATSWDCLYAAVEASGLPTDKVNVILNPNSGNITYADVPSSATWALWRDRAANLSSAGFKTFAYVNLCSNVVDFSCAEGQGDKAFSGDHGVKAEIDKYATELGNPLAGIFFDDAGHTGEYTDAILKATKYANSLGLETLHNPGVMSQDPVLFAAANATVLREGSTPGNVKPFEAGFSGEKSAMLLHSVTGAVWRDYFNQARDRGFKYFYAAETWSSCPSYLEDQLAAIASTAPQPLKSFDLAKEVVNATVVNATGESAMIDGSATLSFNFALIFSACYTMWLA